MTNLHKQNRKFESDEIVIRSKDIKCHKYDTRNKLLLNANNQKGTKL